MQSASRPARAERSSALAAGAAPSAGASSAKVAGASSRAGAAGSGAGAEGCSPFAASPAGAAASSWPSPAARPPAATAASTSARGSCAAAAACASAPCVSLRACAHADAGTLLVINESESAATSTLRQMGTLCPSRGGRQLRPIMSDPFPQGRRPSMRGTLRWEAIRLVVIRLRAPSDLRRSQRSRPSYGYWYSRGLAPRFPWTP